MISWAFSRVLQKGFLISESKSKEEWGIKKWIYSKKAIDFFEANFLNAGQLRKASDLT